MTSKDRIDSASPFHGHFIPVKESALGPENNLATAYGPCFHLGESKNPFMPEQGYSQQTTLPYKSRHDPIEKSGHLCTE